MQAPVEIRYAGVVLGTADSVRDESEAGNSASGSAGGDLSGPRLFLTFPEPLPVGTSIELASSTETQAARVDGVIEVSAHVAPGMRVVLLGQAAAMHPAATPVRAASAVSTSESNGIPQALGSYVESRADADLGTTIAAPRDDGAPEAVGGVEFSGGVELSGAIETGSDEAGGKKRRKRKR